MSSLKVAAKSWLDMSETTIFVMELCGFWVAIPYHLGIPNSPYKFIALYVIPFRKKKTNLFKVWLPSFFARPCTYLQSNHTIQPDILDYYRLNPLHFSAWERPKWPTQTHPSSNGPRNGHPEGWYLCDCAFLPFVSPPDMWNHRTVPW